MRAARPSTRTSCATTSEAPARFAARPVPGSSRRFVPRSTRVRHDTSVAHEPVPRRERMRSWAAEVRERSQLLAERAQAERARHSSVDAAFDIVDRDRDVGGGIIAGALAYRLFIWLLPLALVAVAGFGIAADASSGSPEEAAESLGIEGLVSNSIAHAAESPKRWYALLIGIPILVWATRSV